VSAATKTNSTGAARPVSSIEALAQRAGFEIEWQDAHKATQRVPETTLRILLEKLGLPCGNATQIKQSMAAVDAEMSGRKLPPLITAEVDRGIALPVSAATGASRRPKARPPCSRRSRSRAITRS
jgi:4-alpha-glucanotransferase